MTKDLNLYSLRFFGHLGLRMTLFFSSLLLFNGCTTIKAPDILNTLHDSKQALLVSQTPRHISRGVLSAWQKNQGQWTRVYQCPVVLGRTGIAQDGSKREGDGHTPSGIYPITTAFGYADAIETKLNYRKATGNDFWVDDVFSKEYNQWVVGTPQAQSYEKLRREDNLYAQAAIIEYNMHPIVPGNGSAIFMHIWRNYYKPTAGCVALSQRNIRRLLRWLNVQENPVIIIK